MNNDVTATTADDVAQAAKLLTLATRGLEDLRDVAPTLGNLTVMLEESHQVLKQLSAALESSELAKTPHVQEAIAQLEEARRAVWSAIHPVMEAQAAANAVVWPLL